MNAQKIDAIETLSQLQVLLSRTVDATPESDAILDAIAKIEESITLADERSAHDYPAGFRDDSWVSRQDEAARARTEYLENR